MWILNNRQDAKIAKKKKADGCSRDKSRISFIRRILQFQTDCTSARRPWRLGGSTGFFRGTLYEAARIDGAGPVRQFLAVTLPMLSPLIFFNLIMSIIGSFQVFTQAYVIRDSTSGGGEANKDLYFYVLYLYEQAFRFHNMGYASAMAWVLFAVLLVLTMLVFRSSKGWVHYEGLQV